MFNKKGPRDSKTIKVTIRLLDTSTGLQIWGEDYKHDLTDRIIEGLQKAGLADIV